MGTASRRTRSGWVGVLLVAGAIVAAAFAVAADTRPASAAGGSAIIMSTSSTSPTNLTALTFVRNGPPRTVYIWAKDVKDIYGAGAFQVNFEYDGDLITVTQLTSHDSWLESTGRGATCPAPAWATTPPYVRAVPNDPDGLWEGLVSCFTIGGTPPFGPHCGNGHCSGLLATITVNPGPTIGTTFLNLAEGSYMVSAVVTDPPTLINASVGSPVVKVIKCADMNTDGFVTLGDVFDLAGRWGSVPGDPDWAVEGDLNDDGAISLADVFDGAAQFGLACP